MQLPAIICQSRGNANRLFNYQESLLHVGAYRRGTFGLTLASQLYSVFGMDVGAQAIECANYNAPINGPLTI
ncbi:hypothetical protein MRX96_027861 [Rhipicephalus microplus]